jgi:lysylphosphatidylglycerol synthetase-like protein (DUF2156 family)
MRTVTNYFFFGAGRCAGGLMMPAFFGVVALAGSGRDCLSRFAAFSIFFHSRTLMSVSGFVMSATVRGFLLNFGVYYAVKDAIGAPFAWSPKVAFIARFMTAFATVIAVTKDLPDVEGDKVRVCFGNILLLCTSASTDRQSTLLERNTTLQPLLPRLEYPK